MITINNIYSANFNFDQPFDLDLANGESFHAEKVIRMIPGRRMVAFGIWGDKPVVAKLFFDVRKAAQHVTKEIAGVRILQENKIPTPQLLGEAISKDRRCRVLFFERIFDAKNIEECWQSKDDLKEMMPQLRMVMLELATQHVLGIVQKDLHLKNFLLTGKSIYTLDAAQIELLPKMLQGKACLNNLALFLSQLGIGAQIYQEELFRYYAKARSWIIKKEDIQELFILIKKWNQERWQDYAKKIFRNSSNFSCHKDFGSMCVYDRAYTGPEFLKFLSDPESVFSHPDTKVLKAGRSSTVIKIKIGSKYFVVKRYNIKNPLHFLRRCLRHTRAHHSWRLAQKLKLFHVPTAIPVGFIEKRYIGLRGKSYFIMEYIAAEHLNEFFMRHHAENKKKYAMIKSVISLLKNLSLLGITHGDLKSTNILIDKNENPLLIDLDGAAEHRSSVSLRKAWQKEINRFLENFNRQSAMQKAFQEELI